MMDNWQAILGDMRRDQYYDLSKADRAIIRDIAKQTDFSISDIVELYYRFGCDFLALIASLESNGYKIRYCSSMERLYPKTKGEEMKRPEFISERITAPLIFESEDWSELEWITILKIFGMESADRIVISNFEFAAWGIQKRRQV